LNNIKASVLIASHNNSKFIHDCLESLNNQTYKNNDLIKNDAKGTYNVSIGKKIYLNEIVKWLNHYNTKEYNCVKLDKSFNNDNFTLNNHKLMKKINVLNSIEQLKKDCRMISKNFFKNII